MVACQRFQDTRGDMALGLILNEQNQWVVDLRAMLRRDRVKIPTDWQTIERMKPREGQACTSGVYKATCGGLMHSA